MLLRRLIEDEISARRRKNLVQSRSFALLLRLALERYHSPQVTVTKVLNELTGIAREMREAHTRGDALRLPRCQALRKCLAPDWHLRGVSYVPQDTSIPTGPFLPHL